jgi:hypothetical protein
LLWPSALPLAAKKLKKQSLLLLLLRLLKLLKHKSRCLPLKLLQVLPHLLLLLPPHLLLLLLLPRRSTNLFVPVLKACGLFRRLFLFQRLPFVTSLSCHA